MTHERYRTWHYRYRGFYAVYYSRTYIIYNDWINPYWNFWLLDNPRYLFMWTYHHRYEISVERYEALLRENAELAAQIREMEERGVIVDPNYCPPGVDEDLMYSQEYIEKYRQQ
ncbi:MAG: hypothetical protein Q7S12_03750 [bacterium]|nr:hypothetical protein [bacterium]